MDADWALEELRRYFELHERVPLPPEETRSNRKTRRRGTDDEVARNANRVRAIAESVYGEFVRYINDDLVARLQWEIEEGLEVRERLGTVGPAPKFSAAALHPVVWSAAEALWSDGHHGQAVQRAATFVNAHVQHLLGRRDVSDATLMQQAFSPEPPKPGKPRLRWPGVSDDLTVRAMRAGILQFAQGCFMAIRNPATHMIDERQPQEALEELATLSTLARWIDRCEVVVARG